MTDWLSIKNEYITTNTSQRELARKYNVSPSTLRDRAFREHWDDSRRAFANKSAQKIEEKAIEFQVDRVSKLLDLTDKLTEKIEQAIDELDIYMAKDKKKTRVVEYKDLSCPGKPTKEVIEENEVVTEVHTCIDRLGLQQVANALKSVKDIHVSFGVEEVQDTEDSGLMNALRECASGLFEDGDDSDFLPIEDDDE